MSAEQVVADILGALQCQYDKSKAALKSAVDDMDMTRAEQIEIAVTKVVWGKALYMVVRYAEDVLHISEQRCIEMQKGQMNDSQH